MFPFQAGKKKKKSSGTTYIYFQQPKENPNRLQMFLQQQHFEGLDLTQSIGKKKWDLPLDFAYIFSIFAVPL